MSSARQVAVICATNTRPNPGMMSVDLAFHSLAARGLGDCNVRFFRIFTEEEALAGRRTATARQDMTARERLPFQYACLRDSLAAVYEADAILYWGDFFHMARYHRQVAENLVTLGLAPTEAAALDMTARCFFLTDAPQGVLEKTFAFGGNLLLNCASDYNDPAYAPMLTRFMRGARTVWMRDALSALAVNHLRQDYGVSHTGCDCSLLLRDKDVEQLPRNWRRASTIAQGKAGIFFHRSEETPSWRLMRFARDLCGRLGTRAHWLPWRPSRHHRPKGWWAFPGISLDAEAAGPTLGDLSDLLRSYAFIVTDTYHVSVNAWRLGIPAICIGELRSHADWDVSSGTIGSWRDKRWLFHAMAEALDFYVHSDELRDRRWRRHRLDQIETALRAPDLCRAITTRLRQQADAAETCLANELRARCGGA